MQAAEITELIRAINCLYIEIAPEIVRHIRASADAALEAAYRNGTEDMREAAARWHDARAKSHSELAGESGTNNAAWYRKIATAHVRHAADIRHLSLPEPRSYGPASPPTVPTELSERSNTDESK